MSGGAVWWWLLATLSIGQTTKDVSFSVNTKSYSHVVSDRFLSITIDPALLMDAEYSTGITKIINLARGLAPAYVRLGSPASNRYQFLRAGTHRQHNASYAITEAQWMILNDFAQKSGLEPIVCVNIMSREGGTGAWDTRNLRDLVAYSDRRKYKLSWQFGYELQQHRHKWSGSELGNDLKTLRGILDTYPRYRQSKILAPDVTSTEDPADVRFLQDFLNTAGSALSAVTWHAFEGNNNATRSDDVTNTLEVGENDLADKLGKEFTSKPLWIAESYRDPGQPSRFEDGLSWAIKLGEAAKIGIQTVLKRPQINNLQTPTPDYWVSFLHKTLVGELVLTNDWIPSSAQVQMFSHCTNTHRPATNVFVNDQLRYEQGSMTFFGVNRLPTKVDVTLKLGSFTKRGRDVELHEYVLTRDESDHAGSQVPKVLLNGRRLSLDFTGRLPILTPKVHHYTNKMTLTLPGRSVGFWVVSGAKARACLLQDGGHQDGEMLQRRVRRSATATDGLGTEVGSQHNETQMVQRKSITGSQIVMEIGDWKEYGSKTKVDEEIAGGKNNSEKDIPDQNVATQRSSDGIAPEHTDDQLGNHDEENNATHTNHLDEPNENTEKPKYRISKVLVVFENESGDQTNEDDRRALLVDEETVISDEKAFSRVSRALEKDAFTVPSDVLSLLDMAGLRGPLLSLKRLRERRWEQLQRKKLLAGHQYKKALGLQASMMFPKKFIPGQPKRSSKQPNEDRRGDYDYVTEEDEPEEDEYTQQYPVRGQWTHLGDLHNGGKNVPKPNGGAPAKYEQLWEMERGANDGAQFKERQRHIRENGNEIPKCIKESAQKGSPDDTFAYRTRNERVPDEQSHDIIPHYQLKLRESAKYEPSHDMLSHYETKPKASAKFQCLGGADTSPHETELHEGGPTHEGYYQYTPQAVDYERDAATLLRTSHGKPSYRQEQHRNRRHLTGSVDTNQNHVLGVKEEVITATLAINDDIGKEHEMKEATTAALAITDDRDKEHEIQDVSAVTLAANDNKVKEREIKDVSAVTLATNDNEVKEREIKEVSAATLAGGYNGDKEPDRDAPVERDVESVQAGAEATATEDSNERSARDGDTDVQVSSLNTLTNDHDEHVESAVETETEEKDLKKISLPTLHPILKTQPLIKPMQIQIPKLPLPNLLQSRHLDEQTDTMLQHQAIHHAKVAHLLADIKSRAHKRIEELKKKTLIPKAKAHASNSKAKAHTSSSKAKAHIHSLGHIKETLQTEENNLKRKVEAIRDDAMSLMNTDVLNHLQAADETHASSTEKRNTQNLLKERIKTLLDTLSIRLDQEPSVFERSTELKATLQDSKLATAAKLLNVKQAVTETDHKEEDVAAEKPRAERDEEWEGGEATATEAPTDRKRRHANYNVGRFNTPTIGGTYPNQHSKKRFLKIKELQVLDSPKSQGNVNNHAKPALRCTKLEQETNTNIDTRPNNGHSSSQCASQPDNLPLKTVTHDISGMSSDTDERELSYRTKVNQVGHSSVNTIASDPSARKTMSYNANGHKKGSNSWHLKNIDSHSWGSGGALSGNTNGGNLHLMKHNDDQVDINKRSKRYVEGFSGEIDSDEFLNQRLSMVDSNTNQDLSKNELIRKLPPVEKMPRFTNLQTLKRAKRVRGGNVNREFKDWNLALSSQGLQIEAETFRNDVDKDNTKYVSDGNQATSLGRPTVEDKVVPSKELKRMQKRHYSGNDEASQKLGFFGNILKKIYSLFHSLFDKTLK